MAKKSLKNSKHLVELIGSATLPAIALLSKVDKFAFLGELDASKPEDVARSTLIDALPSVKPEAIAIADEEAVRLPSACPAFPRVPPELLRSPPSLYLLPSNQPGTPPVKN